MAFQGTVDVSFWKQTSQISPSSPVHNIKWVIDDNTFTSKNFRFTDINQGGVSIRKTVIPGMAIPMLKIRRPNGRLIFNMEITIRR